MSNLVVCSKYVTECRFLSGTATCICIVVQCICDLRSAKGLQIVPSHLCINNPKNKSALKQKAGNMGSETTVQIIKHTISAFPTASDRKLGREAWEQGWVIKTTKQHCYYEGMRC